MTRIGSGIPGRGILKFKNKNTRIQAKQAEINRLKELIKEGMIDPEVAERRIQLLEAQIQELEFGIPDGGRSDVEVEMPQNQPSALGAPANNTAGQAINQDPILTGVSENTNSADGGGDSNEFEHKEYGKDDIPSYQANMLKIYHGLA